MKLRITYNNGITETVIISMECSTEELIAKIEHYEYNPNVSNVEVSELEKPVGFFRMCNTSTQPLPQDNTMTTKLPYIGYDKPLTESNSIFSYSERLENATRSFIELMKKGQYTRGEMSDTIVEVWQVDLIDLACTIHDDPEWQEFMSNGQKMTAEVTENI